METHAPFARLCRRTPLSCLLEGLTVSPAQAGEADDTLVAAFQAQLPSLDRYHAPRREGFLLGLLAYDALIYAIPTRSKSSRCWPPVDTRSIRKPRTSVSRRE
jgi:hypothetical protein